MVSADDQVLPNLLASKSKVFDLGNGYLKKVNLGFFSRIVYDLVGGFSLPLVSA